MCSALKKNPYAIGAVAPSSSLLANKITQYVDPNQTPKRILEVGAGTGVFTRKLIEKLRPGDQLDVVEFQVGFCRLLKNRFGHLENVAIFCGDILDWNAGYSYDYIVSALPFNSFSAETVKKITKTYQLMSNDNTIASFFEYLWLPTLKNVGFLSTEKRKHRKTRQAIEEFVREFEFASARVLINMPPAVVHFLRLSKSL